MFISNKRDCAKRFSGNPLIGPSDLTPSRDDFEVIGAFNSAAFTYRGKTGLLLRVAERPKQESGRISIPTVHPETGKYHIKHFRKDDPLLDDSDPRTIIYDGRIWLTSVSHFRLAWSDDGINFTIENSPAIWPRGEYETYGIEDPRVTKIGKRYYITYSAVSENEVAVGIIRTEDWNKFTRKPLILHPFNKDVCLFPNKSRGKYWLIHRPSGILWNRSWMWISESPDLTHWGNPVCLARTRPGKFDSTRIGGGAPPILTDKGFLEIYHGADKNHKYCLGAMLLDRNNPAKIIARTGSKPLVQPITSYERKGFFGNVVFTDGAILKNDELRIYYGASDSMTCLAKVHLSELWRHLGV